MQVNTCAGVLLLNCLGTELEQQRRKAKSLIDLFALHTIQCIIIHYQTLTAYYNTNQFLLDNFQLVIVNEFTANSRNSSEHWNCWRVYEP